MVSEQETLHVASRHRLYPPDEHSPHHDCRRALVAAAREPHGGRSPNLPEALVVHTGAFAIAYVAAVEQRAALVCPVRLWRAPKLHKRRARNRM